MPHNKLYESIICLIFCCLCFPSFAQFKVGDKVTGEASYYAKKFHGRTTANGEKFNMYAMTAAHKELPFNTVLKVVNLTNGKWVKVRINDRGPFVGNRIIDLSYAAAKNIGMIQDGVAKIEFTILSMQDSPEVAEASVGKKSGNNQKTKVKNTNRGSKEDFSSTGTYSIWGTQRNVKGFGIQLAAHSELKNALKAAKTAQKKLDEVYIQVSSKNGKPFYRIVYGAWTSRDKARVNIPKAEKKGYKGAFLCKHL
ncbi:septal ring lytic transglycosylase RlpA family protein [Sediminitomix flava]|uniref:Probable endolytic peptidoglycan transglycosylase RlpA n=1 Tax=Sediminitomix flava TaxID=379075 RepID=A0A315ZHV1_SEDFL|nr:septal ring lytic transglycosylase RlpA family protein [Sediminitomix flava]PWJ44294.1 rare lipoprotein A [Sediminitomix flava]